MPYALPTPTDWVTASWADHKNRNPPSSEPGTDYGAAYGSPVFAVEAGTVTYVKTSNSQATGRVVEYRLDDGRTTRSLHLAEVWVGVGQRVGRGQTIGLSGASGNGSDWYYGPHVHQTLWPGAAWAAPTIDFHAYTAPSNEDDEMNAEQDNRLRNIENMLAVPGAGYGYPNAIFNEIRDANAPLLGGVKNLQERLAVPGAGYDWLPALNNNIVWMHNPLRVAAVAGAVLLAVVAYLVAGSRR